ncbi:MAG: 50S ribosomal protein L18 [Candidatus Micrarchaeia archaeon]
MSKATGPTYQVHFRRRRQGKTNYAKRLALLKSGKPRMVVRKTNKYVIVQFANTNAKGDRGLAATTSKALSKYGFDGKCNTPSAYLTGMLCAKKAAKKGVSEFVADLGLHTASKGNLIFAAVKGAVDAGLKTSLDENKTPNDERITGKHLNLSDKFQNAKQKIESE